MECPRRPRLRRRCHGPAVALRPPSSISEIPLVILQVVLVVVLTFAWNKLVVVAARLATRLGRRIGFSLAIPASFIDELELYQQRVGGRYLTGLEINRIRSRHERQDIVAGVLQLFGWPAWLLNQTFSIALLVFWAAFVLDWPVRDLAGVAAATTFAGATMFYFVAGLGVGLNDRDVPPEQRPVV